MDDTVNAEGNQRLVQDTRIEDSTADKTEGQANSVETDADKNTHGDIDDTKNELDEFIHQELGEDEDDTFITAVKVIDDSGRGEGVGKRRAEDEDLGIYEDTDDSEDSENELERLRAEKVQREQEKQKKEEEERDRVEAEIRATKLAKVTEEEERRKQREHDSKMEEQRLWEELASQFQAERPVVTPRSDIRKSSGRSWSDPRLIQGLSLREVHWKSFLLAKPMTTSMATQLEKSM